MRAVEGKSMTCEGDIASFKVARVAMKRNISENKAVTVASLLQDNVCSLRYMQNSLSQRRHWLKGNW